MFNHKLIGKALVVFSLILLVLLLFVKKGIDERDTILCEAFHVTPELDMGTCPAHQSNTSWFITFAFGIIFFILGTGLLLAFLPVSMEKQVYKKTDLSKLDEEEKQFYNLLKQNEGSMYQSDIIKETGFSKVKTTRILDKLEGKKVIDRKRRGMTNIVVLK